MIPFLHRGELLTAARPGQPTYLHHCPVCGGSGEMRARRVDGARGVNAGCAAGVIIDCPQCQPTQHLFRVLDGVWQ